MAIFTIEFKTRNGQSVIKTDVSHFADYLKTICECEPYSLEELYLTKDKDDEG